ncbi:MAG: hypothetical protein R3350_03285 [Saprospiraceae bacterium]|nr:hypothetical protein [Saprospiraceae bacterium]
MDIVNLPKDYDGFLSLWEEKGDLIFENYLSSQSSFVPSLLPELALSIPPEQVIEILRRRLGNDLLQKALDPGNDIPSPRWGEPDSSWLKRANMVGINPRTIGHFWNIVKYSFTLPASQSAIHFLPIWEPGVVASLYGMASWNINPEFFSPELASLYPGLNTVEKQLKTVVNLLHAMGRTVGMDVIPHTDRFSEIVLANPHFFEWLRRSEAQIVDHRADLHQSVQQEVLSFLRASGPAQTGLTWPSEAGLFFSKAFPETNRLRVLFGLPGAKKRREKRRLALISHLYDQGFEPVPATMGPPYRGLVVNRDPKSIVVDEQGREWREYNIKNPQTMSRVFGPLTRYKLYDRLDDNRNWEIDFSRPRKEVWEYVCQKYEGIQRQYRFDFMRGDMSHVQMRPEGVPHKGDLYYDLHKAVKKRINSHGKAHFAYFAESFLAAPGYMAYGDEVDHLEQSDADTALGDLQASVVGSAEFLRQFRWYLDLLKVRSFAPCFTIMTADKDDPRFDEFYLRGNEARLFIALFLLDMPSYMALGFETRDPHPKPAPNEHYTKLYVFRIGAGAKATHGPYQWGKNAGLFRRLTRIRIIAEMILPEIEDSGTSWLIPPDPRGIQSIVCWTQEHNPRYCLIANLGLDTDNAQNVKIPTLGNPLLDMTLRFSTQEREDDLPTRLESNGKCYQIDEIAAGEARIYQFIQRDSDDDEG